MDTNISPIGRTNILLGDPFVYRHDNIYYLTGTAGTNEGFLYWDSPDLVHWQFRGWAYHKSEDSWADGSFWAPEVKYYKEKFYMTYSALDKKTNRFLISLAVSSQPGGPYTDLYAPWFDFGFAAIDGHIFVDSDGKPYLYFSRNGFDTNTSIVYGINYGVALSEDLSKPEGDPVKLTEADVDWEMALAGNRCNEGATVLKHNNLYFMTYSANNTVHPSYGIGYAVSEKPLGPWRKAPENPILSTNIAQGISGPGHNSIIESPDGKEMFIVYHSHADINHPSGIRAVHIDRIYFDESGRLVVGGSPKSLTIQVKY